MIAGRGKRYQKKERGAALAEYALAVGILLPVIIISAMILYQYEDSDPDGAIVERGEGSLNTVRDMAPTKQSLCQDTGSRPNQEKCL